MVCLRFISNYQFRKSPNTQKVYCDPNVMKAKKKPMINLHLTLICEPQLTSSVHNQS